MNVDVTVYLNGFHGIVLASLSDHGWNFIQAGSNLYMRSLNCRLKSELSRVEHTISNVLTQITCLEFS